MKNLYHHQRSRISIYRFLTLLIANLVVLALPFSGMAAAATGCAPGISDLDCEAIQNGWVDWVPNTGASCVSSGSSSLVGSDNVEKAYNYFVGKGLTPIQSAGIVGNFMVESAGVNPRIVQGNPPYFSDTIPPSAIGKAGYGIAQWTDAGRQQGLIAAAHAVGLLESDLGVQLDYVWKEATTSYLPVLNRLKTATTTDQATQIWMGPNGYENPAPSQAHLALRQSDAAQVYSKYGNNPTPTPAGCGGPTNFISNFIEYKQCDDPAIGVYVPWKNVQYGVISGSVCDGGCGPSAMAMIITNLTGQMVTPDLTATYGRTHGTSLDYGGSWDTVGPVLGTHWGLKNTMIGFDPSDIPAINQVLRSGGLVLADGHGPLPFSSVGHFLVIRAIAPDGNWLIATSMVGMGHDMLKEYSPTTLTTSTWVQHNAWGFTFN